MQLGVGERGVLLGVGRQHRGLVAGDVRVGELAAQRRRHVEVADLVARRVPDDPDDAVLRLAVLVGSQHRCPADPSAGRRQSDSGPRSSPSRAPRPRRRRRSPARGARTRPARGPWPARRRSRPRRARRRPASRSSADAEALAVERVRRGVPRRQLGRVQVPALVEAALQRAADQPVVVRPRGPRPRRRRRPGSMLVEPSESRTPVPAAAACITSLAWSAAGCSSDWCAGGDARERRVVVGAVVQAGQPVAAGVHHPGDQRGAVRARGSTAASRPGSRTGGPASRRRGPSPRPGRRWSPWAA